MEEIRKLWEGALSHYEKKEYDRAENLVDKLLSANPDFHRGWFLKGVILEETGRSADARACYDKGGNLFNMWFRLALQVQESDPGRAIAYYGRALTLDQKSNIAWLNQGLLYERLGKREEAASCFSHITPGREVFSRIVAPSVFMLFLIVGGIIMIGKGEKTLSILVFLSAVVCFFLLKRDAATAVTMLVKKNSGRQLA
ncbi:MAG TPA: tetratricopeptide repeat protein [Thermodesulfovibrionales bacterium]|nr:tetratricopeptide repeat protein [Thermodesulfovibrionales bacterium]